MTNSAEPIAIIGMGCRLPGAPDIRAFWRMLAEGREAIREVPQDRWNVDTFYDPRPSTPGKMITRRGGFVEDIDRFDAYFFGIPPRQAIRLDPQQRMLLEASWEAMENAGLRLHQLAESQCGVFIGICSDDYLSLQRLDAGALDIYTGMGGGRGSAPGRLAYFFGVLGPCLAVDAACSSSLVAVHLAVNSLRAGNCAMAFAGGANAILHPLTAVMFSQAGMLSPDGRCKAFDERANGFVRSEGAGVVLLKRLSEAVADGDPVWAVIRGTATNNDGSTSPMMTPSRLGQELVLKAAYKDAGISPSLVDYLEAHGTGTAVGDPIEMEALAAVVGQDRAAGQICRIGSSKTNVGHLEAGAGVVGLIKAALSLKHRQIPASLHCETLNPKIPWERLPFRVQRELTQWPDTNGRPAVAGINSFGISGTNAHAVVEAACPEPPRSAPLERAAQMLTLSAQTEQSLQETARAYQDLLAAEQPNLLDLCYSAGSRRTHHDHRLAVVARTREELYEQLAAYRAGEACRGVITGRKTERQSGPVFVFSGVGTQWLGMGRELSVQEPVFRDAIHACDRVFRRLAGFSVLEQIEGPSLDQVEVMQPAIFSIQVALAALWRSWGVEPAAVVGHSLGEMAAAHIAGVLTLEEAAHVVRTRSRLMQRVNGKGRMAAVELSIEQARKVVDDFGGRVDVAVSNSPTSSVLSGEPAALEQIVTELESRGVFARFVQADVAFHSRQMEPFVPELLEALAGLKPASARIPFFSTVTGAPEDGDLNAGYWARNMRQPVMFSLTLERLLEAGYDNFLEISPHPVLAVPIGQTGKHVNRNVTILTSLRRNEDERFQLMESLAALYTSGHPLHWGGLFPSDCRFIPPPAYCWDRERYWFEDEGDGGGVRELLQSGRGVDAPAPHYSSHPFLAHGWQSAEDSGTHFWEAEIGLKRFPYLKDHRLQGTPLLPASLYVEMALAASLQAFGPGPRTIRDVSIHKAVFLPSDESRRLQLVMKAEGSSAASFRLYSQDPGAEQASWVLNLTGKIEFSETPIDVPLEMDFSVADPGAGWDKEISGEEFYELARYRGLDYGPAFRGIERAWQRADEMLVQIRVPDHAARGSHQIHPIALDIFFQTSLAAIKRRQFRTALPVGIESFQLVRPLGPGERLWVRVRVIRADDGTRCDAIMFDAAGQVVARELGHHARYLEKNEDPTTEWLYENRWEAIERSHQPHEVQGRWLILSDAASMGEGLRSMLDERGEKCLLIPAGAVPESPNLMLEVLRQFRDSEGGPWRGVVHLRALDTPSNSDLTAASLADSQRLVCGSALHLLQALAKLEAAPRVWFVTRGAQTIFESESPEVAQAPLIGLGRVAASEHWQSAVTRLDLDPAQPDVAGLFEEVWNPDREQEMALRAGIRYANRLCRLKRAETLLRPLQSGESFCLDSPGDGILDHLTLRASEPSAPGPGEIQIDVAAVGLNFLDVLRALNMAPGLPTSSFWFGMECSGTVLAVGDGVRHFHPGDEVIALHSGGVGCFTRYLTISARNAFRKPAHLTSEEASTIPVAYQTAYYALNHLGRMRRGESVLIHAAAGGVGLAAVRLAQQAGVEVFATAGSDEKREYLKSLGVKYVMNSRTLDFADEVMAYTGGRGVDLVLNSLAGEAIPRSLELLATGGRFLELGKRDIYADARLGLLPFQRNLSFHAIDLLRMSQERPETVESLTAEVAERVATGEFPPLPHCTFPVTKVAEAFRYMAQAKHLGKVIITLREQNIIVEENLARPKLIRDDATYLVTGGLGALGLAFARDLVARGARHIALMGRRPPSEDASKAILQMRAAGAAVQVFSADVSLLPDVDFVLAGIAASMPPLKGVLHAAGVVEDGVLHELDWEPFERVFAPKVQGGWNLHARLAVQPLDFFVLFSSAAATFGAAGQANYSAANSWLDALARFRTAAGMPALSIAWGAWDEIGMAASPEIAGRMEAAGRQTIPVIDGVSLLWKLLARPLTQATVVPVDWPALTSSHPELRQMPLLTNLIPEMAVVAQPAKDASSIVAEVIAARDAPAGQQILLDYLRKETSRVMRIAESRLDSQTVLTRFGLDSLMAVELKNRLEVGLGLTVPVVKLLAGTTLAQLAAYLFDEIAAVAPLAAGAANVGASGDFGELSDTQVDAILGELLV